MAEVLGRVTGHLEGPRGPDALYGVRVPKAWLEEGAALELELPRHLSCAACEGGGCDACERSGALTLRGKAEPPELLELRLPAQPDLAGAARSLILRVPERGGFPKDDHALPRGCLLLSVSVAAEPDPGVRRLETLPVTTSTRPTPTPRPPGPAGVQPAAARSTAVRVAAVLLVLWLLGLVLARALGWG